MKTWCTPNVPQDFGHAFDFYAYVNIRLDAMRTLLLVKPVEGTFGHVWDWLHDDGLGPGEESVLHCAETTSTQREICDFSSRRVCLFIIVLQGRHSDKGLIHLLT